VRSAAVLKPSLEAATELLAAKNVSITGLTIDRVAETLLKTFGNRLVAVTDGLRGSSARALQRRSRCVAAGCGLATTGITMRLDVFPVDRVVDATGAGDAFLGGMTSPPSAHPRAAFEL
jgi:sugar/nucleoside kinase (ribokinase family)